MSLEEESRSTLAGKLKINEAAGKDIEARFAEIKRDVSDLFPPEVIEQYGKQSVYLPDYVFPPDQWTQVFQAGLVAYDK